MLGVVLVEKRWMISVGLSGRGRGRKQPPQRLFQRAQKPGQCMDHAHRPQSGLKPAARIARIALHQHLCSGPVAQGFPQPLASPGQVVAHQRPAVVTAPGQEGDVVLALGLDVGRDLQVGRQGPDRISCADGDAAGGAAQPHGLVKAGEAQPQVSPVAAHAHHPPGLVGGEQHREIQVLQQGGEGLAVLVAHVDGLELRGWWWLGRGCHGSDNPCSRSAAQSLLQLCRAEAADQRLVWRGAKGLATNLIATSERLIQPSRGHRWGRSCQ